MAEKNDRFDEISEQLDENILAVKGTLELMDASVTEDELRKLLHKAIERMDIIQRLSSDMLVALKHCFERKGDINQ